MDALDAALPYVWKAVAFLQWLWQQKRLIVAALLVAGTFYFGPRVTAPLGVLLVVKELSHRHDNPWKSTLGPCGALLSCLSDDLMPVVVTFAIAYGALLLLYGREPAVVADDGGHEVSEGAVVESKRAFMSDSKSEIEIRGGLRGSVLKTDKDGDAQVAFAGIEAKQWVRLTNFSNLKVVKMRPRAGVVWLHGLGDTAAGCSAIRAELQLGMPAWWKFPCAPVRQVSVDWGFPRRAWFDISTAPLRPKMLEDETGIKKAVKLVHAVIKDLEDRGVEPRRIIVGGISQGGAVALAAALTYPKRVGGAACLGGWLPRCVPLQRAGDRCAVFWLHGAEDDVVLPSLQDEGVKRLEVLGVDIERVRDDSGHVPGAPQVLKLQAWMQRVLA